MILLSLAGEIGWIYGLGIWNLHREGAWGRRFGNWYGFLPWCLEVWGMTELDFKSIYGKGSLGISAVALPLAEALKDLIRSLCYRIKSIGRRRK